MTTRVNQGKNLLAVFDGQTLKISL